MGVVRPLRISNETQKQNLRLLVLVLNLDGEIMYNHMLGYDPADVPSIQRMARALNRKVKATSVDFVVKHGRLSRQEILMLTRGQDVPHRALSELKLWYMVTRREMPKYKRRKKSVHLVTKAEMYNAVQRISEYYSQNDDSVQTSVRKQIIQEALRDVLWLD